MAGRDLTLNPVGWERDETPIGRRHRVCHRHGCRWGYNRKPELGYIRWRRRGMRSSQVQRVLPTPRRVAPTQSERPRVYV